MQPTKKLKNKGYLSNNQTLDSHMEFIKRIEGEKAKPYLDPVGVPTIAAGVALGHKDDKTGVVTMYSLEEINRILTSTPKNKTPEPGSSIVADEQYKEPDVPNMTQNWGSMSPKQAKEDYPMTKTDARGKMSKADYDVLVASVNKWNNKIQDSEFSSKNQKEKERELRSFGLEINNKIMDNTTYTLTPNQIHKLSRAKLKKQTELAEEVASEKGIDLNAHPESMKRLMIDQFYRGGKKLIFGDVTNGSNEAVRTKNYGRLLAETLHRSNKLGQKGIDERNEKIVKIAFNDLPDDKKAEVYQQYTEAVKDMDISKHLSRQSGQGSVERVFGDFAKQETPPQKPTKTFEDAPKPASETKPTSSLSSVGNSFVEKVNKIDTGATESLFKPAHHITEAERDSVMTSPVYKDKTSPFFNTAQKLVEDSFKYQYPGKSRGYHNIREGNSLPTTTTPLRDPSGMDINKEFGNTLAREVENVGEPRAVKTFQQSMNEVSTQKPKIADVNVPWIAPKHEPLKEDGVFGPKTKTRMQEVGATHGVSSVLNTFRKKLNSFF